MTQRIVINAEYGGFSLSDSAVERYAGIKGIKLYKWNDDWGFCSRFSTVPKEEYFQREDERDLYFSNRDIERNDPALIQVVEEMGDLANGILAKLKVVEIPDSVEWQIEEYDGLEWISEKHRTWS